mmetsp:Transcript_9986/g.15107  ORF Transcript_9986/g.15107 Transcript_9986/m.15107 type:complete len:81 (+) Transcript_9986:1716-1958(+)
MAIEKMNKRITDAEVEKSRVDGDVVRKLVIPTEVMFNQMQKELLISFLANKDVFLGRLIPLLLIYHQESNMCHQLYTEQL